MRLRHLLAALTLLAVATLGTLVLEPAAAQNPTPYWEWHQTYAHRLGFLVCTRRIESDRGDYHHNGLHDGGYQAPGGGGYQIIANTWPGAITRAGYPYLAWKPAEQVPMKYQDLAAIQLVRERGAQPWGNRCSGWLYQQPDGTWGFK